MRGLGLVRVIAGLCALALPAASARALERPNLPQAQAAFYALPGRDRIEAHLRLMATGDFVAMASREYGNRLYDATTHFQSAHGLAPTGVLTSQTRSALAASGGATLAGWGMRFLDHPSAEASLAVPSGGGLEASTTARGVALDTKRHTMSVAFSFFKEGEADLASVFDNLAGAIPARDLTFKMLRPDFLAVAGSRDGLRVYSRYIPVPGGIAGFTFAWDPDAVPVGDRVAIVMANELHPRRMRGADLADALPGDPPDMARPPTVLARQLGSFEMLRQQQDDADERKRNEDAARQIGEERARAARAADDARRDKEAQERRTAQELLRADHLVTAQTAAADAIADAAAFVKANHDDPQLLDHIQGIADLKAAAAGSDPEALERKRAALQARLKADPIYAGWAERQSADRRRADERDLRDTMRVLDTQRRFLFERVAADPTGPEATRFLGLTREADSAAAAPRLGPAQSLMVRIDAAIKEAGLTQSYTLAQSDARKVEAETKAAPDAKKP